MRIVNGLEAARAALRGGATQLLSPPYAACHAGVGYYAALVEHLRAEFPEVDFTLTLCCGNDPAIAHDALRLGFTSIICECSDGIFAQLQITAAAIGATILRSYPQLPKLDDK